ncbi:hypothetical protein IW261DRAFT_1484508 [Armillaria novae-zelandiae]|uniref:Uncharacterized protein n=1 Tax=Armillaria novae-zelandiae TaxID=153914 RepID=A0AA39P6N7_9AGAR|nr:hypothetical protein IW261DRAFT_1484508 [Armillaria novae-zelandiae]
MNNTVAPVPRLPPFRLGCLLRQVMFQVAFLPLCPAEAILCYPCQGLVRDQRIDVPQLILRMLPLAQMLLY